MQGKDRLENGCRGQANCSLAVEWKKLHHDEFVLKRVSVNMEKVVVNESIEIFQNTGAQTNKPMKPYRLCFIKLFFLNKY